MRTIVGQKKEKKCVCCLCDGEEHVSPFCQSVCEPEGVTTRCH